LVRLLVTLLVGVVVLGCFQINTGKVTDVSKEVDEGSIDLFYVGLLFVLRLVLEALRRHSIAVDLICELVLNVNPEHSEQILWVSLFIEVPILVQIIVFQ